MKLSGDAPTVLLPFETAVRELDGKVVTASLLALRGVRTIVGTKEIIGAIARNSRRILWQGKDAFDDGRPPESRGHLADRLGEQGSAAMFLQDEGGIFPVRDWAPTLMAKYRASYLRGRHLGQVSVWGQRQREVLTAEGIAETSPIVVTGCPRFDLCGPEYAWLDGQSARTSRPSDRPYILMCTRFTSVAHQHGPGRFFTAGPADATTDAQDLRLSIWARDASDLVEYLLLVRELAASHPGFDIIVRPHPSEDAALYRNALRHLTSVTVTGEGSVLDWIRGASLVVHTNCTTGVEAVLAGRPVLQLLTQPDERHGLDKEVAREAGVVATTVRGAAEMAARILSGAGGAQESSWSPEARAMLANLDQKSMPMLVDATLGVIGDRNLTSSEVDIPVPGLARRIGRRLLRRGGGSSYVRSKRGRIEPSHVEMILDGVALMADARNKIRVSAVGTDYVVVEPS